MQRNLSKELCTKNHQNFVVPHAVWKKWTAKQDWVTLIMTNMAIMCEKNPSFKKEIQHLTQHSNLLTKAFAQATLEAVQNNSNEARAKWANAVTGDKIYRQVLHKLPKN